MANHAIRAEHISQCSQAGGRIGHVMQNALAGDEVKRFSKRADLLDGAMSEREIIEPMMLFEPLLMRQRGRAADVDSGDLAFGIQLSA